MAGNDQNVNTKGTQAEERVRDEALLQHFVRAFSSAYTVNLKEDTFEILHMDHAFQQVFTMDGKRTDMEDFIRKYVHPDDRENVARLTDSAYVRERLKTDSEIEFTLREQYHGEERVMRALIMRLQDADHAAVGFMDVTDQIRKEKEKGKLLEDALEMALSANRAKTTFLFNMSHDIRTPMNAILGFTRIAKNHIDDRERVLDSLEKIEVSGGQLLNLINDILEMSRIESGKVEIKETPAAVTQSFENTAPMLTSLAISKSIDFTLNFGEIRDNYVWVDGAHANRVLVNLVTNAIKYTNPGGKVNVRVEQVSDPEDGKAWYRYRISDTGIGMSEEFITHIFEEFSREKTSTESRQQGTGLGLAIAKRITESMGGRIEVESRQGAGSTFTVLFPFRVQTAAEIRENYKFDTETKETGDGKAYEKLKGLRVLLVEDNELNREIAVDILEDAEMIVSSAEDGQIAVNMIRTMYEESRPEDRFDVVLMDIQMPVMDGYTASVKIREMEKPLGKGIPIIAMTANAFAEDRQKAIECGMDAHLGKPIQTELLKETLLSLL